MNRRSRGVLAAIACVGVIAGLVVAAPGSIAAKPPVKAKTKTSFKVECLICLRSRESSRLGIPLGFSGKVRSNSNKCVEGRTVRVIQVIGNVQVTETTTGKDGSWSATTIGCDNEYRAVVTKEKRGKVICKKGKTKPKTPSNLRASADGPAARPGL